MDSVIILGISDTLGFHEMEGAPSMAMASVSVKTKGSQSMGKAQLYKSQSYQWCLLSESSAQIANC